MLNSQHAMIAAISRQTVNSPPIKPHCQHLPLERELSARRPPRLRHFPCSGQHIE
jgi:hypothetical protein